MATVKSGRPTFPVWVGSLNEHVTEKDLRKHFSKFGEIASVKLKTDNATGKSLGFGWSAPEGMPKVQLTAPALLLEAYQ